MLGEETDEMSDETQGQEQSQGNDFDFDAWLGEQPEHVRKGYEGKTQGLHSALERERQERKEMSRQLKELLPKAEKGSEAEKALGEMSSRLEQANQRAAFLEDALRPEIGCSNPKAAFLVASADGLFKRSGEPDWGAIKAAAPELFGRKTPPGNAGSGNGSPPASKADMNSWIRAASGRG